MTQSQPVHILIVEDDEEVAVDFKRALERFAEIRIAERVDQVFEQLADFEPHLILLDIVLEGERVHNSWEAGIRILERLKNLRSPFSAIPVIVVTARIGPEVEDECRKLGAVEFLRKPVPLQRLRQAVQGTLIEQLRLSRRRKIFISSTMQDLQAERWTVKQAIEDLGPQYVSELAEQFRIRPGTPRDICQEAATACDLFVLLLGERYGTPIVAGNISPTEDEYNTALKSSKPIMVFVKDVPHREPRLDAFLTRVSSYETGHWIKYFKDNFQLRSEVMRSIRHYPFPDHPI